MSEKERDEVDPKALRQLLADIDSGALTLERPPGSGANFEWFCGYPTFKAAGWTICVFDDAGDWDYLEWVESPDGKRTEYPVNTLYEDLSEAQRLVHGYGPANLEQWGY